MVNHDHQVEEKQDDLAIHIVPEHSKEADAWAEKKLEAWWRNGRTRWT